VVLTGYIDESYSGESPPRMFSLTCTIAQGKEWPWIEMAWQKCLEEKNASLKAQGRILISRYHSVDINNFREEFADWDGPERQAFCEQLMKVFSRHEWGYEGYLINLQELVEELPETSSDPLSCAYHILLKFLMLEIGDGITKEELGCTITLFHERCAYNGVFSETFNELINDSTFAYKKCFTTIEPLGWEDCIPLQAADLIAYENFKEGYRQLPNEKPRERRKILEKLISLDSFAPHAKIVTRANLVKLKGIFDGAKKRQVGRLAI
jgi:hypothetical protein